MRSIVITFVLALSPPTLSAAELAIEGTWVHGGVSRMSDFVIENRTISFLESGCKRIKIEIIEKFDGNISHWDKIPEYRGADDFETYVIKINYARSPVCLGIHNIRAEYIRMTIPKINRCYSSTYFYIDIEKMKADKANNWNGNYTSGWAGLSNSECR